MKNKNQEKHKIFTHSPYTPFTDFQPTDYQHNKVVRSPSTLLTPFPYVPRNVY